MKKLALIIHGFPGTPPEDRFTLEKYFKTRNYDLVMPKLMTEIKSWKTEEIVSYIMTGLTGRYPDVIVGISIGGMIAPHMARIYPKARLILLATGPYLKTKIWLLNQILKFNDLNLIQKLAELSKKIPFKTYLLVYRFFNYHEKIGRSEIYQRALENWRNFQSIEIPKLLLIWKFIQSADNTKLLGVISNRTLIMGGSRDNLMPEKLSRKMSHLTVNSQLYINDQLHYDVFTKESYKMVDKFLEV